MGDVIVTQFVTLDGVVFDPDVRWGTDHGGWAFRYGPGPVERRAEPGDPELLAVLTVFHRDRAGDLR
jgi:hypothetical protein